MALFFSRTIATLIVKKDTCIQWYMQVKRMYEKQAHHSCWNNYYCTAL